MSTYTNYSKLEVDGTISSSVQGELIGTFTTMPKASALNEGKTIYYTGATSGNFVQNTFYTCTKSGSTYSWTSASPKQVSVDSALSETSTNPVQNKVIATALKGYATKEDIATVYKPKGSVASANLPTNPRIGDVYNLTDDSSYGPAGTNVVYTEDGTWDALAGIVDISGKQDKISAGTGISISENTVSLATSGVTAGTKGGTTAVPVITVDAYGRVTSIGSETIYPPTTVGTSGQIWVSDGNGTGVWQSKDTTPTNGSTNAITSGAVYSELAKKQPNLTFDSTPTQNSSNPVTSGGVYNELAKKQPNLTFDSTPTSGSSNPVTSGGIYTAIDAKQSKLTFDSTPTSGSNNPVTSGGIFSAINGVSSEVSSLQSNVSSLQSTVAGKQNKLPVGTRGQILSSNGEEGEKWIDASSVGKQIMVKFNNYTGYIPVNVGCQYSTDGGSKWTVIEEDGLKYFSHFTAYFKFNPAIEGNGITSEKVYAYNVVTTNKDNVLPDWVITTSRDTSDNALRGGTLAVWDNKAYGIGTSSSYGSYPNIQRTFKMFSIDENGNFTAYSTTIQEYTAYGIWNIYQLGNCAIARTQPSGSDRTLSIRFDKNLVMTKQSNFPYDNFGKSFIIRDKLYYTVSSDTTFKTFDSNGIITSLGVNVDEISPTFTFVANDKMWFIKSYEYDSYWHRYSSHDKGITIDTNGIKTVLSTIGLLAGCIRLQVLPELRGSKLIASIKKCEYGEDSGVIDRRVMKIDKNDLITATSPVDTNVPLEYPTMTLGDVILFVGGYAESPSDKILSIDYNGVYGNPATLKKTVSSQTIVQLNKFKALIVGGYSKYVSSSNHTWDKCVQIVSGKNIYEYGIELPITETSEYFIDGVGAIASSTAKVSKTKSVSNVTSDPKGSFKYKIIYEKGTISSS